MNKLSYSASQKKVKIISRNTIPALKSVEVDSNTHNLGLLLDFRKHKDLASFIPEQGRLSLSWVRLKKGETLDVHAHPTASMIIITEGEGTTMGDAEQSIKSGDIVMVPPYAKHGFKGKGEEGFWALSMQFEGLGLYEDPQKARVRFIKDGALSDPISLLEKDQVKHEERFRKGAIMKLISSEAAHHQDVKDRLLEALNFWSDWFQRILAARVAAGNPKGYQELAEQHFAEEAGHNRALLNLRHNMPVSFWEPILDATSSWFYQKVLSGTPEERTILMHCVLESASCIFHSEAQSLFPEATHFSLHSELDQEHSKEGFEILRKNPVHDIEHLREILWEGWRMAEYLTGSMARYAKGKHHR
jgi:quercetin dioxygenase-like cupin family protein